MISFSQIRKSSLFILYVAGFVLSLHTAIPSYITSSFLSGLLGEHAVSYLYAAGSLLTVLLFYFMPRILRRFGNYRTCLALAIFTMAALFGVAAFKNPWLAIAFLMAGSAASTAVGLSLDIFIEHDSTNAVTGNIRGVYLATLNTAWLVSPFLAALILGAAGYAGIFLVAGLIMLPFLVILVSHLRGFKDPEYADFAVWKTIRALSLRRDVRFITAANFLLQFFYAWMIIYTPIYLNVSLGFDWLSIGKIFTIMLVPFVILEGPLGRLADRRLGEKEMLTAGFIVMALATAAMPLLGPGRIWLWAALLFITRVGAAMVETMCDTYFFKNIGERDAGLISLYRSMVPVVYVVAPLVGAIILLFAPFAWLFPVLGILMLCGLRYSLAIHDTL